MLHLSKNQGRIAATIIAVALFGCSTGSGGNPRVTTAGSQPILAAPPAVQDCARISTASPSKYRCGDQTYTSFDLTKMQRDYAAQQNAGK